MRQILAFLALACVLNGRENPFLPSDINNADIITTNITKIAPPLDTQIVKFPSDAREISHVVFYYKSIDGSIKQKVVDINASFDWHDEILIKNQISPNKTATKILDVSVTSIKPNENPNQAVVAKTAANPTIAPKIEPPLKTFNFMDLVKFDIYNSKININTKDKKIRDFTMDKPSKIIIDFQKTGTSFNTKSFKIDKGSVKKVIFGSHEGYYRAVIWLDGDYNYAIRQTGNGYSVTIK
ncbi:putative periplasmic protein (AMIN domain) [Campylobacter iguaniorum]|uniref:AMIN domain-containing protein n=1 Tax=Campylobacter iguaniorum TaxID=1244531 RepID=UPI0007C8AB17|nr:AMIN domain-containing protein [Campylobacter iguaniorum]ANE35250.1 putative periplasmic protein (AMIN domain) [Campylobacter iguaniorum]